MIRVQTIINTLQGHCPQLIGRSTSDSRTSHANAPLWQPNGSKTSCEFFNKEFSTVSDMIKNAQKIVKETQQFTTQLKRITQPNNFNRNSPSNLKNLAQSMLKNAQSQAEILKLANQVKSDFNTLSSDHLKDHIKTCNPNSVSNTEMKNTTWGNGYVGV